MRGARRRRLPLLVVWFELQYRFVGLDLLLLDVDANLIVDILPAAVSAR